MNRNPDHRNFGKSRVTVIMRFCCKVSIYRFAHVIPTYRKRLDNSSVGKQISRNDLSGQSSKTNFRMKP